MDKADKRDKNTKDSRRLMDVYRTHFKETGKFYSPNTKHGTLHAYKIGCRCDLCVASSRAENRKRYSERRAYFIKHGELSPNISHGTAQAYTQGCLCELCQQAAKIVRVKSYTKQREHLRATGQFLGTIVKHGSNTAYLYGCRCDDCILGEFKSYEKKEKRIKEVAKA